MSRLVDDVADRLDSATDEDLGRALAAEPACRTFVGQYASPCRFRPLMAPEDRCARCRVRMEADRRIKAQEEDR